MKPGEYRVNEIFFSLQGEGARAGSANVFVRFSGCNLKCAQETEGFDCDTEFSSGTTVDADYIADAAKALMPGRRRCVILTGGEPLLQLDVQLLRALKREGFFVCVETNGTMLLLPELKELVDWISCSPKTAEHTLRVAEHVDELRYVRAYGQGIPKPRLSAGAHYISPAFEPDGTLRPQTLAWCVQLCKDNPDWFLSVQQHKLWRVR